MTNGQFLNYMKLDINLDTTRTIHLAVKHFGAEHQTLKACEELTELHHELLHALDGRSDNDKIREEMADVEIMLEQLKLIYGPIDEWKKTKLKRLEDRLNLAELESRRSP